MKRRSFITGIFGSVLFTVPVVTLGSKFFDVKHTKSAPIATDFTVDYDHTIRYIGAEDNRYTVCELHEYLQNEWGHKSRLDGHILKLDPPLNVDDNTAMHLHSGGVEQVNAEGLTEMWCGLITLGTIG